MDPENQLDFNKQFLLLIKELNTFASERKKVLHEDSKVKVKGLDALMEKYSSDASFKKLVEDMQLINGDNPLMIFEKEDKVSRFTLWQTPGEPIKEFKFNGEMVPGVKVKERPSLSLTTIPIVV